MTMQLQPGDSAPAFRLVDDGDDTVGLNDLAGRKFVIYFYP
jgi:peroxiredoxin Q/BCP